MAGTYNPALALSKQAASETAAKSVERVLGTITAVDAAAHSITVKDDRSSAEVVVSTANTRTLIKVLPGAKDLKGATRITAEDLQTGDRVDVRGFKDPALPTAIAARSVVLMSARELQAKHQADTTAWQNSTVGIVSSVDAAARTIAITSRTPKGPQQLSVLVPPTADLTRYSPDDPKTPVRSQFADIQPGDQVRIIGSGAVEGSPLTAERIYSGAFRTVAGTVTALNSDSKGITLLDLQTKQPLQIKLTESSTVHKLPPEMAAMAASRLNASPAAQQPPGAGAPPDAQPPDATITRPRQRSDLAQMVQHLPAISLSELKAGDAVIVSGVLSGDRSHIVATNIIAGVEPILQTPAGRSRQSQSFGDWSLDMGVPNQ